MATTIVEMQLPPGLSSPKLFLFPDGSDTLANTAGGDDLVEETNRDGLYLAAVTEALVGVHYARVEVGGTTIGSGYVRLQDDTNTYPVVDSKREAVALDANVSSRSSHSAGAAGTSAANKVLASPSNLLATDGNGKVTPNDTSTILQDLLSIKGGQGWEQSTDSLEAIRNALFNPANDAVTTDITSRDAITGGTTVAQAEANVRGANADDLKNISDQVDNTPTVNEINTKLETEHGAGSWVGDAAGSGDTEVTDATADDSGNTMEVLDGGGAGIEDVTIRAYNKSDFDASNFTVRATTSTDSSGGWGPIMLNTGTTYTITLEKSGLTMGQTEVTP